MRSPPQSPALLNRPTEVQERCVALARSSLALTRDARPVKPGTNSE